MRRVVLDASEVASWAFPDEGGYGSTKARQLAGDGWASVPSLWWYEIRNTLLVNERRGRIRREQTDAFLAELARMHIRIEEVGGEVDIRELARRWQLTFYDAAYLELAERLRAPLATLDRRLAEAAEAAGVELL